LVLQNFVADKLPDDGNLLPKHVGAGARYEVCFVICLTLILVINKLNAQILVL